MRCRIVNRFSLANFLENYSITRIGPLIYTVRKNISKKRKRKENHSSINFVTVTYKKYIYTALTNLLCIVFLN